MSPSSIISWRHTKGRYCWWFRNPAITSWGSLSHHLQGFVHLGWCRISSNSTTFKTLGDDCDDFFQVMIGRRVPEFLSIPTWDPRSRKPENTSQKPAGKWILWLQQSIVCKQHYWKANFFGGHVGSWRQKYLCFGAFKFDIYSWKCGAISFNSTRKIILSGLGVQCFRPWSWPPNQWCCLCWECSGNLRNPRSVLLYPWSLPEQLPGLPKDIDGFRVYRQRQTRYHWKVHP